MCDGWYVPIFECVVETAGNVYPELGQLLDARECTEGTFRENVARFRDMNAVEMRACFTESPTERLPEGLMSHHSQIEEFKDRNAL